jgi:glutaredoxin-related protein
MRRSRRINFLFFVVLGFIFGIGMTSISLDAQVGRGRERIKGVVVDKDNKPIASAHVVLDFKGHYRTNMKSYMAEFIPVTSGKGIKFETKTDSKGRFRFIGLGYGQWEITASHENLKPAFHIIVIDKDMRRQSWKMILEEDSPQANGITSPSTGSAIDLDLDQDLDPETKKLLGNAKKLFELGEQLLEADELEKAVACFHLAAKRKPQWSAPYLKMGYAYFNLGNNRKALENFKKFLELNPESPEAPTVKELTAILKEED